MAPTLAHCVKPLPPEGVLFILGRPGDEKRLHPQAFFIKKHSHYRLSINEFQ